MGLRVLVRVRYAQLREFRHYRPRQHPSYQDFQPSIVVKLGAHLDWCRMVDDRHEQVSH